MGDGRKLPRHARSLARLARLGQLHQCGAHRWKLLPSQLRCLGEWVPLLYPLALFWHVEFALEQTWDSTLSKVLTVVTDRTHAGTGLTPGAVDVSERAQLCCALPYEPRLSRLPQLLVHRRLLYDDNFGVDEALNEPGLSWDGSGLIVRGTHRLTVSSAAATPAAQKNLQQEAMYPPRSSFAGFSGSPAGAPEVQDAQTQHDFISRLSSPSLACPLQGLLLWCRS